MAKWSLHCRCGTHRKGVSRCGVGAWAIAVASLVVDQASEGQTCCGAAVRDAFLVVQTRRGLHVEKGGAFTSWPWHLLLVEVAVAPPLGGRGLRNAGVVKQSEGCMHSAVQRWGSDAEVMALHGLA